MPSTLLHFASSSADSVSSIRDTFTVNLRPPLAFQRGSKPRLAVQSASIWNTFPSISAAQGNATISYTNDLGIPAKYTITLADGAYEIADFNRAISNGLVANGHSATLITLVGIAATGRVTVTIDAAGWQVFWPAGSPYARLGITLGTKMPAAALTTGAATYYGASTANISPVNSLYVHCSLASGETVVAGAPGSVIAAIAPNVPSGSLIAHTPNFPAWIDCARADGSTVDSVTMRLTDSDGTTPIDTGGEHWSITLLLETV